MTEPEDLEEDLFADLYDADETPATSSAPPAATAQTPSQPPPTTKTEIAETPSSTQPAPTQQQQPAQEQKPEPPSAQNGAQGTPTAADTSSGGQASNEPESQGTGIKEDGPIFQGGQYFIYMILLPLSGRKVDKYPQ
ncbi:uncharacterized protein ARB_05070 [Trichophyton benhamiae CBS 112371]|uniref:Uncharacterized protein n=1 Tax=Arthroderma benhamiae (strain ATCC MYA-4681 / CBS 112371) TaxID=663331 RepID=D4AL73_ARTBC|nr:uncharacterized protein ARB_05070 [Trichophyton benhamiae CBS 112371]EFE36132.1 hypothetical protein ARB_05070 [Trichophyton benhamiae CBS 112371]